MTTADEVPEAVARIGQEWSYALDQLSEEDKQLLILVRTMGQVLDPRYEMKGIYVLVGRALVDAAFRSRVLEDADAVLAEVRGYLELPANTHVRCVENTADSLTVVLPPMSRDRSQTIRDLIVSRTSKNVFFDDDEEIDDNDLWPPHTGDFFTGDANFPHLGDVPHDAVRPMTL